MQFRATVVTPSELHSRWERERRIGGEISGVRFRKVKRVFVSEDDPLPPDAVVALSTHRMVRLEISAAHVARPAADGHQPAVDMVEPDTTLQVEQPKRGPGRPPRASVDLRVPQKGWPAGKQG